MQTLIVVGSQGCGKTQLAERMRDFFGFSQVFDTPHKTKVIPSGVLYLTDAISNPPADARILSFGEAKRLMGLEDWTPAR
jgi:hypothetical protein